MSEKSPYKQKLEQDVLDIELARLKAENYELRQAEREYDILDAQVFDLEHRCSMLEEETKRELLDSNERTTLLARENSIKEEKCSYMQQRVQENEEQIAKLQEELEKYQILLQSVSTEANDTKGKLQEAGISNYRISQEKRGTDLELELAKREQELANKSVEKLKSVNEVLSNEQDILLAEEAVRKKKALELELELGDIVSKIEFSQKERLGKENEIGSLLDGNARTKKEIEERIVQATRMGREKQDLELKIQEIQLELDRVVGRSNQVERVVREKEEEIGHLKIINRKAEENNAMVKKDAMQLQKDNSALNALLDLQRGVLNEEKRMKEQEMIEQFELSKEKRQLEKEVVYKDFEARRAAQELARANMAQETLLDNKFEMSRELEAVSSHAETLANQNRNLHAELDRFVEIDDKVRKDLDSKSRVDSIKRQNQEEYLQSSIRVDRSRSPARSSPSRKY
eukprot:TRINITY_DN432_c0_g1_i1.p1 TRINITY_DN432_c0_g1~~TRINITY_DN432_c0_g1_i1.p1  ORF type:complete len:459 (-),score=100.74 TRINITY_DN432_c0_g1_i1:151-1527(-)